MRLADFVLQNIDRIVEEWESFARSTTPGAKMDGLALRDHAPDILRATVRDMNSEQTASQRSSKSKGHAKSSEQSDRLDDASAVHALARVGSGFDLIEVVSEYRALRASVLRLWRESDPHPDLRDLDDMTRFNESVDQSLARAVKSYTQRIDQSRRMFLAILGHDLRNPLNSIMMLADMASKTECADAASRISASAGVITQLVNDLIDFAATGLGAAMPLSPARVDLGVLCDEVLREFRAAHPDRELHLESSGDLSGEWDAGRLRQVASNLLGNAMQHGSTNGAIELSVRAEGPDVVLAVHNDGVPIPADVLPNIFDPLVRGLPSESRRQRRPGSLGLGLYIARAVVSAHGGVIDVKSSREAGTVFTVRLPRHRAMR